MLLTAETIGLPPLCLVIAGCWGPSRDSGSDEREDSGEAMWLGTELSLCETVLS